MWTCSWDMDSGKGSRLSVVDVGLPAHAMHASFVQSYSSMHCNRSDWSASELLAADWVSACARVHSVRARAAHSPRSTTHRSSAAVSPPDRRKTRSSGERSEFSRTVRQPPCSSAAKQN
ncbi:hypothetical protein MHYP_G00209070 [Metynnis hypsauchen]